MKLPLTITLFFAFAGCQNPIGNPALASKPYPIELHSSESVSIQVIRNGEFLQIVNSTADDYKQPTLWINQRYSGALPTLHAGSTLKLNLWSLRDAFGEQMNAGGIWRTDEPTSVVLAELQLGPDQPMVGLVVIGQE